ncbi:zf-HC2 domain-containing protein [bacterium]|nr:zf-HC2 domain-containing protein [bacterium]
MKQHLLPEQLEQFKNGKGLPDELRAAADHLAFCSECRKKVLEGEALREMISSIRDRLDSEEEDFDHLTYEQTEAYLDETLDEVDREIAESHLQICSRCAAEAMELKSFKNSLQFDPAEPQRLSATGSLIRYN